VTSRPPVRAARTGVSPEDLLTGSLLGAVALLGSTGLLLWGAGQLAGALAHGHWPDAPPTAALHIATRLPHHLGDPAAAWPATARDTIPGPAMVYPMLAALSAAVIGAVVPVATLWTRRAASGPRRERDVSREWARPRRVRELLIRHPTPGRVVLGHLGRRGRLVAAEPRRSVLVVAPTQAGKTSRIVVPTVLRWTGPMLVTSVKSDVLRLTLTERLRRGPAYVFDPTGALTHDRACGPISGGADPAGDGRLSVDVALRGAVVKWSPLLGCASYPDAERHAAWLVEAGGDPRAENATFWEALAAKLLAPLLYAAAGTGRSLRQVAAWIDRRETTEVSEALGALGDVDALDAWAATCAREERQRDSVYATAEAILRAFASPSARSATDITPDDHTAGRVLDVDRLITDAATLYLVAPAHEQGRLRPLFESLVQAVLRAAQDVHARTGRPLDPALMVMLDEAANIAPLRQLASYAATGAGQGIQICSVWQDLAQVEALYGRRAATVVNGHTARLFLAGSADLGTLDATSRMIGDYQTRRTTTSTNADGGRSISEQTADTRLAPVEYLRQLPPDTAVLLYGRAPALRLTTTPWYAQQSLRRLVPAEAAAESDQAASAAHPGRRLRARFDRRRRHPQAATSPQIQAEAAATPVLSEGSPIAVRTLPRPQTSPDHEPWSAAMPLQTLKELTGRLGVSRTPSEAITTAWQAADLAEEIALALVHRGSTGDVPAYLTAADAFATVRTDLADHTRQSVPSSPTNAIRELDDVRASEVALAELARALITTLSTTARDSPHHAVTLACSRAAVAAADAAEATTRASTS
jgi:type IV secretion system protein VirD4